jgi:LmbE family N-acetylglucosaminyl deacetylase
MTKIIFFQAHPDDLELNCGHLIHFLATKSKKGYIIKIASITKGEFGLPGFQYDKFKGKILARIRTQELYNALAVHKLKPSDVDFIGYIDGLVFFNKELVKSITEYLNREKPDIIFAPEAIYTWYYHNDHINTGKVIYHIISHKLIDFEPKLYFYGSLNPNLLFGFNKESLKLINKLLECHKTQFWFINKAKIGYRISTWRRGLLLHGWKYAEKYRHVFFKASNIKKNKPTFIVKILTHWFSSMPWFKAKYPKDILKELKK